MDIYNRIRPVVPYHNIDKWYGPYNSLSHADASIPYAMRSIGMTVGIKDSNYSENQLIKEYWYNGGVSSSNLVEKFKTTQPKPPAKSILALDFKSPNEYILTNDIKDIVVKSDVDEAPYPKIILKTKNDSGLVNEIPTESRFVTIVLSSGSYPVVVSSKVYNGGSTLLCSYDHDKGKWTVSVAKEKEEDKEYQYETFVAVAHEPKVYPVDNELSPGYWDMEYYGLTEGDFILSTSNDNKGGLYYVVSILTGGVSGDYVYLQKILPIDKVSSVEFSGSRYYNIGSGKFSKIPDISSFSMGNTKSTSAIFVATYGKEDNPGDDIIKPVNSIKKAIEVAKQKAIHNVICVDYNGVEDNIDISGAAIKHIYAPMATIRSLRASGVCVIVADKILSSGRDGAPGHQPYSPAIIMSDSSDVSIICNSIEGSDSNSNESDNRALIELSASTIRVSCGKILSYGNQGLIKALASSRAHLSASVAEAGLKPRMFEADSNSIMNISADRVISADNASDGSMVDGNGVVTINAGYVFAKKICSPSSLASTYINYSKGDIRVDQSSEMAWNNHKPAAAPGPQVPEYIVEYVDKMISRNESEVMSFSDSTVSVSLKKNRKQVEMSFPSEETARFTFNGLEPFNSATLVCVHNRGTTDIKFVVPSGSASIVHESKPFEYEFVNMTGYKIPVIKAGSYGEFMFIVGMKSGKDDPIHRGEIRVSFKPQI